MAVISQIAAAVETVNGVKLLDIDPGQATNRTVLTFVGEPDEVIEASVRAVSVATDLIDMRGHKGEHPRFGATDVCPLVPLFDISMEETILYARKLAQRLGEEIGLPVYCYENASFSEERSNLAVLREGEYEELNKKMSRAEWKPDFGPKEFNPKSGATAVGARQILVAYNVNLNTKSRRIANDIACKVREKGRIKHEVDPLSGEVFPNIAGESLYVPGSLKCVKGIGWFIEEYEIAQVSMNLTNIDVTNVNVAFDEVSRRALAEGILVTGSEIVGLIPKKAMVEAGLHYLSRENRKLDLCEREVINTAVESLGLNDLKLFNIDEKIIEYVIEKKL